MRLRGTAIESSLVHCMSAGPALMFHKTIAWVSTKHRTVLEFEQQSYAGNCSDVFTQFPEGSCLAALLIIGTSSFSVFGDRLFLFLVLSEAWLFSSLPGIACDPSYSSLIPSWWISSSPRRAFPCYWYCALTHELSPKKLSQSFDANFRTDWF